MNSLRKITTIYLVCLCSCFAWAQAGAWEKASSQEVAAAYKKAAAWYTGTQSYYFKLKYASYNDHVSKAEIESSEGYYKRAANNYITEAMGIKTIRNASLKVIIDTADKLVTMMEPGAISPAVADARELETLLAGARTLKKVKQQKGTRYRIDFNKNAQYDAYEFVINDKGLITALIYYYSERTEKQENDEGEYEKEVKMSPRLEILFSDYEVPAKYTESEFGGLEVVTKVKGKLNLTPAYKDFRILDYRPQTKN